MAINECIPFYRPGKDITCKAAQALTGCRVVKLSSTGRTAGPGLVSSDDPAVYQVDLPSAGGRVFGVTGYDVASGAIVPIKREGVLPVKTSGAIATADLEVKAAADGTILAATTGATVIGKVLTPCSSGDLAEFVLYEAQFVKP